MYYLHWSSSALLLHQAYVWICRDIMELFCNWPMFEFADIMHYVANKPVWIRGDGGNLDTFYN